MFDNLKKLFRAVCQYLKKGLVLNFNYAFEGIKIYNKIKKLFCTIFQYLRNFNLNNAFESIKIYF